MGSGSNDCQHMRTHSACAHGTKKNRLAAIALASSTIVPNCLAMDRLIRHEMLDCGRDLQCRVKMGCVDFSHELRKSFPRAILKYIPVSTYSILIKSLGETKK